MKKEVKLFKEWIKKGKWNVIKKGDSFHYLVNGHSVCIKNKKGRKILLCDCLNSTKFTDSNICIHKEFVYYIRNRFPALLKLDSLIDDAKQDLSLGFKMTPEMYLVQLEEVRNLLREVYL